MSLTVNEKALNHSIEAMSDMLQKAGRTHFGQESVWENCLSTLMLILEPKCRTHRLLEALPYDNTELDQLALLNTMANLGYQAQSSTITANDIDPRLLPCLFVDQIDGPAVILSNQNGHMKLYRNQQIFTLSEEKLTTRKGKAWFFQRHNDAHAPTSKFMRAGSGHSWFRALLGRFKGTFAQVLTAGFILNLIALATPFFIMLVYDRVIAAGSIGTLPMLCVGAALAIGFELVLRRIRSRSLSWFASRLDNIVSNRIFSHLIGLSPSLIERASVPAQIARIKTFESVRDFFSGSVFMSLLELPFVIVAALAIYAIAGNLAFVPVAMIAAYALLFVVVRQQVKTIIRMAAKTSSARQSFAIETFGKINAIRGYGLVKHWKAKFRDLSGKEMMAHFRLAQIGLFAETAAHTLTLIAAVLTVGFGVHLIWAGAMSTGALVATMILVWRVLTPFYSLCTMIPRLEQLRNSVLQVNKLMDIDTEAMEAKAFASLPKMKGNIDFQSVDMRYGEGENLVFSNLSFRASVGDLVVVHGENGSGKSTMLKLIKGLYHGESGMIRIDGFDIRQLNTVDLRRQIAYMPQTPHFFKASIRENLRYGNPVATDADIQAALEQADAWADVQALPEGLETSLGGALSSSLATRLSLARAYMHHSPIMLIDELPNTLLSSEAGRKLKAYLTAMKGKRTCIVVTHREDFMKMADTVICLNQGDAPMVGSSNAMIHHLYEKEAV